MRYPNFLNGSRVVFSTRKQRGPLWQAPRTCRPASRPKTWGCQPTNFIVQCRNSQRPGCMADTTGPMPLIRWRDEGKRRLGLGFTSLGRSRRPFAPRLAHTGDGRVEIAHWRLRPPATLRRHLERPDGPAPSTGERIDVGSGRGSGLAKFLRCGARPRAHALSVLAMPAAWRLAISASLQPSSRSTWVVCSPRSGVGKPADGRVSPNCTSCQATRNVPALAC